MKHVFFIPKSTPPQEAFYLHWQYLHEPLNTRMLFEILDRVSKLTKDELKEFHDRTKPFSSPAFYLLCNEDAKQELINLLIHKFIVYLKENIIKKIDDDGIFEIHRMLVCISKTEHIIITKNPFMLTHLYTAGEKPQSKNYNISENQFNKCFKAYVNNV